MSVPENGKAHPIVHYGDPVLHRPCQKVTTFDDDLVTLVADMFASMYEAEGVGLAANQIGVDLSVFVMDIDDRKGGRAIGHIVNPVLEEQPPPRTLVTDSEGCLSVPGQYTDTARVDTATVSGYDMYGKPTTLTGEGYVARCLQHETDHLNGIVFVDRLPKKLRKKLLTEAGLSTERPAR